MQINPQTGDRMQRGMQNHTNFIPQISAGILMNAAHPWLGQYNNGEVCYAQGASAAALTTGMRSRTAATPALQRSGTWLHRCLVHRTPQVAGCRHSTWCFGALPIVRSEGTTRGAIRCQHELMPTPVIAQCGQPASSHRLRTLCCRYERPPLAAKDSSGAAGWPVTEHAQVQDLAGISASQRRDFPATLRW